MVSFSEPNVHDRRRQCDMTQTLTSHATLNHLDTTLFTNNSTMLHALALPAQAFVVLNRTEDFRTK